MPRRNTRRPSAASNLTLPSEILESRQVLAGNVLATVSEGVLTIRGDAKANNIQVNPQENGTVTVSGLDGTRINFLLSRSFTFTGVQNIVVEMNAGDDVVSVGNGQVDAVILNDLQIDTAAGDDTVNLRRLSVRDDVTVTTGDGSDVVKVDSLNVGGQGVNSNQNDLLIDTSRISTSGVDQDQVTLFRTFVARNATITTGADNDTVVNDDRPLFVVGIPTATPFTDVLGNLNINTGDGNDSVDLDLVRVGQDLTADLQDGNDQFVIRRSLVIEELFVDGGDDNDTFTILDTVFGDLDLDDFEN